jgi:cytosine/adenosine deaminase-related metal-dependent hydrolase
LTIITANYIFTNGKILTDQAIAFSNIIEKIDTFENLTSVYPDAKIITTPDHSVLFPGLINAHVHLEFSGNTTELKFGSFLPWLHSVIAKRDELLNGCEESCIDQAIDSMLRSGTTTFGAVSSYGFDLENAKKAPQKVIFFNEVIGSQANMADALWADFEARLRASEEATSSNVTPAIAVHSPYSVHPILVRKAVALAKEKNLPLSAHFLESQAEKEWLENSTGEFAPFFNDFLQQTQAVTTANEFLTQFDGYPTLFTHAIWSNEAQQQHFHDQGHHVIHCPVSNRLLGNGRLNIDNTPYILGTDGLSSHYHLSLFEEMKIALFMHTHKPLQSLATELLTHATATAADALHLNRGEIQEGMEADFVIAKLPSQTIDREDIALHLILHPNILNVYIDGEQYV